MRVTEISENLQRCHIIEGMVQLLTNGLVLQLLSIQFIWRSEVNRRYRQVSRTAAKQTTQKQDEKETDGGRKQREEEDKKIGQLF